MCAQMQAWTTRYIGHILKCSNVNKIQKIVMKQTFILTYEIQTSRFRNSVSVSFTPNIKEFID